MIARHAQASSAVGSCILTGCLGLDYSDLTVIIPTFNEMGNIREVVSGLTKRYRNVSVTVSDDGSDDGTREAVKALGKRNGRITLLDRSQKREHGLAASVLDAALLAKTKKIVVMDGDGQHPLPVVGSIAIALDSYDLVVGVRTHVKDWGMQRRVISKGMSSLSYLLFALRNRRLCNDMMSGFFGIDAAVFKDLIARRRKRFVGKGYKVLLDILKTMDRESTIGEVYYKTFHIRKEGNSKFGFRHVLTTLGSALG